MTTADYTPITIDALCRDMQERPEYYYNITLTLSSIRSYVARDKLPVIQHIVRSGVLEKTSGQKLSLFPAEVRLWIAFGRSKEAALKVVKMRDWEAIKTAVLSSPPISPAV